MSDITVSEVIQRIEITTPGPQGIQGPAGVGVPAGGTTGQVLKKTSNSDYATAWQNETGGTGVPNGGTTGQVLKKNSNADGDAGWADDATGGAASLPDILPATVTASVLGGTVARTGLFTTATPATGIAAEATVQSVLSSVTSLYTTLGEALTNGFIGIAINAEA